MITSELWQAHYQDSHHNLDCTIENHYDEDNKTKPAFLMWIDSIPFGSNALDDWELLHTEDGAEYRSAINSFSLLHYGNGEEGYHDLLQSYRLQINLPVRVFSLTEQRVIPAALDIILNTMQPERSGAAYMKDGARIIPNATVCEAFTLMIGNRHFPAEHPSELFEPSLQSICRQIAGSYELCCCFGCLYSDYSPYGQDNIGSLWCFERIKENYLKIYSKYEGEYTIWDAFAQGGVPCQETAICGKFAPRINCLGGYRGCI